jgi:formate hydrogenlyase transcriptional activator
VILTPGGELRVPMADLHASATPTDTPPSTPPSRGTLRETERELIRRTLEECRGIVGGPHGAAARLGLKRTTLLSRMKKLGLERREPGGVEGSTPA